MPLVLGLQKSFERGHGVGPSACTFIWARPLSLADANSRSAEVLLHCEKCAGYNTTDYLLGVASEPPVALPRMPGA